MNTNFKKINVEELENYEINEDGVVRNKKFTGDNQYKYGTIDNHGYRSVKLCTKYGKKKKFLVHRLVNLTFNGTPPKGKNVTNHINENKLDNYYKNLEWTTRGENVRKWYKNNSGRPERMTEKEAKKIKDVYDNQKLKNISKIASLFPNHSYQKIFNLVTGKTFKHLQGVK